MKSLFSILIISTLLCSCELFDSKESNNNHLEKKEKIYNGIRKNYHKGKLASTVTYKDSLKNGPAINYYPNGSINMEFNYKDNKKHGEYKWYYKNGKIYIEGNYSNGKKHGIFKTYRDNGKLKAEMPWNKGIPCVGLKEYFESGNLKPVPRLVIKHNNTIKLDNFYSLDVSLSDNSNASFYEGSIDKEGCFNDYYPKINIRKNRGEKSFYVAPGQLIMRTLTIIAKIKTRDKNFHIIKKNINISAENRP